MLRIKPEVDLKELEKFGFRKEKYGDYCKSLVVKSQFASRTTTVSIMVDNTIHIGRIGYVVNGPYCIDIELELLFDLIEAGLVEKVSE